MAEYQQIFLNICYIWKTVPDSQTSIAEQNVQFHGGICLERFQLDLIRNGRLAANIDLNMCNILKNVPELDHYYRIKCAVYGRDIP